MPNICKHISKIYDSIYGFYMQAYMNLYAIIYRFYMLAYGLKYAIIYPSMLAYILTSQKAKSECIKIPLYQK